MQKRHTLAIYLAVVLVVTAVVSCIGQERRVEQVSWSY